MGFKLGDIIVLEGNGQYSDGVECTVTEISNEGEILKAKAIVADPKLAKIGFLIEGDDYIIQQWDWSNN